VGLEKCRAENSRHPFAEGNWIPTSGHKRARRDQAQKDAARPGDNVIALDAIPPTAQNLRARRRIF